MTGRIPQKKIVKTSTKRTTSPSGTTIETKTSTTLMPEPQPSAGSSRLPQPASRLPQPGSRLPQPGSRLPQPGSRLPQPGSRLPGPSASGAAPCAGPCGAPPRAAPQPMAPQRPAQASRLQAPGGSKTVTTKSSVTEIGGGKTRTKTTKTTTTTTPPRADIPEGQYVFPMEHKPGTKEGRQQIFSSPPDLRQKLEAKPPVDVRHFQNLAKPGETKDYRMLRNRPNMPDVITGSMDYKKGPVRQDYSPRSNILDQNITMHRTRSELEEEVEQDLMAMAAASKRSPSRAKAAKTSPGPAPMIITEQGPIPATGKLILERRIERSAEGERIIRHLTGIKPDKSGGATQIELNLQELQPRRSPGAPKEVISLTSTLALAPGVIESGQFAEHQIDQEEAGDSAGPNIAEISRLIDEETNDVNLTLKLAPPELKAPSPSNYPLRKKLEKCRVNSESMALLEETVDIPASTADEAPEEMQPEVVAAIMHTEEHGLTMGSVPTNVYDYLFPDVKDEAQIDISSVAPVPLQDVVVPISQPVDLHTSIAGPEIEQAVGRAQNICGRPNDSVYTEQILQDQSPTIGNTATTYTGKWTPKRQKQLVEELPPWGIEDVEPIIKLVGADVSMKLRPSSTIDDSEVEITDDDTTGGLEYILIPEPPQHISRVQLRGSQKPSWFPGYIVALPDVPEVVKVARSPSAVLTAAWQTVKPNTFADDSFLLV